jgi:cytochrome P450
VLAGLIDGQIARRQAMPPDEVPADDLLAMLLSARDEDGSALSAAELHDQCMVMFQAGHETSATALLWWSWLMARHPETADQARKEVDGVLAGREPSAADAAALPYLCATLKEAMRLYPPIAALMTRRAIRGFELAGRPLPAGTLLRITPWVIHRDPRWFPQPDAFRPERFLADDPTQPRSAWMPFGVGPRVCIGQHFAMLEMTLVAALLLQRCTLETLPDMPPPEARLHVTLRPVAPLWLRLRRRGPAQSDWAPAAPSASPAQASKVG